MDAEGRTIVRPFGIHTVSYTHLMFLFFNDIEEDFGYMMQGYQTGIITEERMQDALRRILGLKASLKLHEKQKNGTLIPPREGLEVVGCREHLEMARKAAERSITLVKDTQHNLPCLLYTSRCV